LYKASRQAVEFCREQGKARLAVGDVSVIQDGIDFGRKPNQKISQWPHGQFVGCMAYKAREYGIAVEQIPEDYSTRTCSYCRMVLERALRGRKLICPVCDAFIHRGTNVAANIFSRARFGEYAQFQVRLT